MLNLLPNLHYLFLYKISQISVNQFIRVDSDVTIKTTGKELIKDVTSNYSMKRRQAVEQTKIKLNY